MPSRAGAKPGDGLYVTGPVGAAMLGFEALRDGTEADSTAYRRPMARLPQGQTTDVLQGWAQNLARTPDGQDIVVWRVAPGMVLPPAMLGGPVAAVKWPPNTSITIKTEASGPAFDAGVTYRPRETVPIALAASLRNLGPDLEFEDTGDALPGEGGGGEESLPSRVRIGIAVAPQRFPGLPEEYNVRLLFDIESDLREISASSQHFGGVLTVHDAVEIRGGVLFADNPFLDEGDGDRLVGGAFGIGLRLQGFEAEIAREVSVSELGDETHFGVGWRF